MRRDSGSVRIRIELKIEIDVDAYENNRPSGRFEANTSNTHGLREKGDFDQSHILIFLSFIRFLFFRYIILSDV
jgi:hypothetical protein